MANKPFFSELYDLPEKMYLPYFKLKVQELLLFLDMLDLENTKRLNQYVSGHVETIKEILHRLSEIYFRYYLLHIRNCIVINNFNAKLHPQYP